MSPTKASRRIPRLSPALAPALLGLGAAPMLFAGIRRPFAAVD